MAELFQYPSEDLKIWNGCQRNWDYSKPVKPEHVQRFIDIALSAPSKNNLNLLEIQVFENSLETQQYISHYARNSLEVSIKGSTQAPLTFFFGFRETGSALLREESPIDYLEMLARANDSKEKFYAELSKHSYMAAALIVGAVSIKAIEFGYKTGINCCFMANTKLFESDNKVFLSLGIGHPLYEDHNLRGYVNGSTPEKPTAGGQGPYRTKWKTKFTHVKNNEIVE